MAHTYQHVKRRSVPDGEVVERRTDEYLPEREVSVSRAQQIINVITSAIVGLLALRFLLVLFGASAASGFANFVYSVTRPLIEPFRGLLNIDTTLGATRFEAETLIAIVVYLLIGWLLAKLVAVFSREPERYDV